MSFISAIAKGFSYPFKAVRIISGSASLFRVVMWLTLFNVVLFLLIIVGGSLTLFPYLDELIGLWITGDTLYWDVLSYAMRFSGWLVTLFLLFFVYMIAANFAAGFFHEALSRRVEDAITGTADRKTAGFWIDLKSAARSLIHGLGSLFRVLVVYVFLAPLNLIPVFGSVLYSFLLLTYTFFRMGAEFLDYPFEVNGLERSRRKALVAANKALMIGFGGSIFLILLVPVANLAAVPVGVVGATILYCEVFRE